MSVPKGGRGIKAPYKSITIKVPEPLLDDIKDATNYARSLLLEGRQNELQAYLDALKDAKTALQEDGLQN